MDTSIPTQRLRNGAKARVDEYVKKYGLLERFYVESPLRKCPHCKCEKVINTHVGYQGTQSHYTCTRCLFVWIEDYSNKEQKNGSKRMGRA